MPLPGLNVFSYGFHFEESVRAVVATAGLRSGGQLVARVAEVLPQPAAATRTRLAQKLVQRYFPVDDLDSPFLQLVRGLAQSPVRRELLYWQLTKTDQLVGALARGLFHPHFVERQPPSGLTDDEFRVQNGGALLPVRPVIVARFAESYAARIWNFAHPAVVQRALHILEEAGLVRKRRLTELRGHPLGYEVALRELALPTFLYCLHDEFAATRGRPIALRRLHRSRFARTFVLWPEQVNQFAAAAARHRFLELRRSRTSASVRLTYFNLEKLVGAVLVRFGSS